MHLTLPRPRRDRDVEQYVQDETQTKIFAVLLCCYTQNDRHRFSELDISLNFRLYSCHSYFNTTYAIERGI